MQSRSGRIFHELLLLCAILCYYSCKCEPQESQNPNFYERYSTNTMHLYSSTTPIADDEDINSKTKMSEIFDQILGDNYDIRVRPPGKNGTGPTEVAVSVYLRTIENIDDVKMEYSVQMTFRQEWIDSRIKYHHIQNNIQYLQLVLATRIWMPDLFILNEKKGVLHDLMIPNVFTRIFPNGRILQSYRITLLLSCIFDLKRFPLDIQSCPISMASYGWTTKDLMLKWWHPQPIQMVKDFNMARFVLTNSSTENCHSITKTGNYSCIKLYLTFSREFGFYLIQIYIPCGMLVIVSWVSFWLEPNAVEARVSLGVTTILTIVTQTYGINVSAPPASYVKALDVWTAFCQGMVFAALIQFAIVNYISHFQLLRAKKLLEIAEGGSVCSETDFDREKIEAQLIAKCHHKAKRIDVASKIIFPCLFVLFNISYWLAYL